jgi:hypothetical protein
MKYISKVGFQKEDYLIDETAGASLKKNVLRDLFSFSIISFYSQKK